MENIKAWHDNDEVREILASIAAKPPKQHRGRRFNPHNRGMQDYTFCVGRRVDRLNEIYEQVGRAAIRKSDNGDPVEFTAWADGAAPEELIDAAIRQAVTA